MIELLKKENFPNLNRVWEPLDYKEWVGRSFLTNLLKPDDYTGYISESLKLSTPLEPSIFSHHFSGHIGEKDRVVCFLLNPRQDIHSNYEFYRIISQTKNKNTPVDYSKFKSSDLGGLQKFIKSFTDTQLENIVNNYWKDELNRFELMKPLTDYLEKMGNKIPSWSRFKTTLNAALIMKRGFKRKRDEEWWTMANHNIITVDILSHMSMNWELRYTPRLLPHLIQMILSCSCLNKETNNQILIFFGQIYKEMFKLIEALQEKYSCFPWRIDLLEELNLGYYRLIFADQTQYKVNLRPYQVFLFPFSPIKYQTVKRIHNDFIK